MLKELREFLLRGNVLELAVAFVLGAAFTTIVRSLADDVLMPPLGLLIGDLDFKDFYFVLKEGTPSGPYSTLEAARSAGAVSLNYGLFVTAIVVFAFTGTALFLVIRAVNRLRGLAEREQEEQVEPTTKSCSNCYSAINIRATRCAFCTSAV